jgi:hypothetical protein
MERTAIAFIVFVIILFLGIFIMIKPQFFALLLPAGEKLTVNQPFNGHIIPPAIITFGSTFIITSIVGLCVVGFIIFKELGSSDHQKNS